MNCIHKILLKYILIKYIRQGYSDNFLHYLALLISEISCKEFYEDTTENINSYIIEQFNHALTKTTKS